MNLPKLPGVFDNEPSELETRMSYPRVQHLRELTVRRGDTSGSRYADHPHATVVELNQHNFELTTTQLDELIHRLVARRMEIAAHDAQCTEKDS